MAAGAGGEAAGAAVAAAVAARPGDAAAGVRRDRSTSIDSTRQAPTGCEVCSYASSPAPRTSQCRNRFKDVSVSFRSMKLQKFRYCCIALCSRFRSLALLTHGQPSALKRSKSALLLVGHGPFIDGLCFADSSVSPDRQATGPH